MLLAFGAPTLAPILIPGGIGVSAAEALVADIAAAAALLIANLANSLLSGFNDILLEVLELDTDCALDIGSGAAEVRKIAHGAVEGTEHPRVV